MGFRVVALDIDNTLADFMGKKRQTALAAARAMRKAGLRKSEKQVLKAFYKVYDVYGVEFNKSISRTLIALGVPPGNGFEKVQQAGLNAYLRARLELRAYPDVKPTLSVLKKRGIILAVVTDSPRNKAWHRLDLTGLSGFFDTDFVVTLDDTLERKPSKSPFKLLFEKLKKKSKNLKSSEVLMVGDHPGKDVVGAKAAGFKAALAVYGKEDLSSEMRRVKALGLPHAFDFYVPKSEYSVKPDFEIKRFRDLLKIVK